MEPSRETLQMMDCRREMLRETLLVIDCRRETPLLI